MRHSYRHSRAYVRPSSGLVFGSDRTSTIGNSGMLWKAGRLRGDKATYRPFRKLSGRPTGVLTRAMHGFMAFLGLL
jgi:hypothetical protein